MELIAFLLEISLAILGPSPTLAQAPAGPEGMGQAEHSHVERKQAFKLLRGSIPTRGEGRGTL